MKHKQKYEYSYKFIFIKVSKQLAARSKHKNIFIYNIENFQDDIDKFEIEQTYH